MLRIGITGGIGSGKTVVCKIFKHLGVPIFNADYEAKKILTSNQKIIKQIKSIFGTDIYLDDSNIDRKKLANIIFSDSEALNKINSIIHPEVKQEFDKWCDLHNDSPYVIEEAAILFESGTYKNLDKIVSVISPRDLRINRVMERDSLSENNIQKRINSQISDKEKIERSDFILNNDEENLLIPQILDLHSKLIKIK